tara:strand:+ start:82 stop:714 length:633 start_codon:yes stop_codon:yes gene_type:complete
MSKESLNTHEKLAQIQMRIKAPKSQYNAFGKYYYRSAEDILEALKPFEQEFNVCFTVDEEIKSIDSLETPIVYVVATARIVNGENGEVIAVRGNAIIDFDAKGMQMPQRTGAASSYSKKYALGNLLLLDDNKDPDSTNKHGKDAAPTKAPTPMPAPKPTLKAMTKKDADSFIKGIGEGKFEAVEKYLTKYKNDATKESVALALSKAKSGK